MYYLLKNQPATGVSWPNVTFATVSPAATIPGNVSIQIGSPTNGCYPVTATGSSGSSTGGGVVTRTITAGNLCRRLLSDPAGRRVQFDGDIRRPGLVYQFYSKRSGRGDSIRQLCH